MNEFTIRTPEDSKPVIYLSGAVGEMDEGVIEKFASATKKLRDMGYIVINPCEVVYGLNVVDLSEGMRRRLMKMMLSHQVICLDNYSDGPDVKVEMDLALNLGISTSNLQSFLSQL